MKSMRFQAVRESCCEKEDDDSYGDCDSAAWPKGTYFNQVLAYAQNETLWLDNFHEAWKMATENGFKELDFLKNEDGEERDDVEPTEYGCHKNRNWHMCRLDDKCIMKVVGKSKRGKDRWGCVVDDKTIT